ncbi:ras gtpase-activating protein [Holotrichia oblita]|uniref:Ras gtpase-activating protein n=1 Tax=Holotrichia oblita TaxID=644536 RepID=A0ACB9TC78_HOLOL|nr:ras gtpase-activating protein [Holotrichia oblita]
MADDYGKVRVEERLKIKIGEAKNLQCRNHVSLQRDVYCTLSLDQEEIFRTSTIEKTLSPFFGEEFQFEVPRNFRYLSVYVYDRDRHLKQDKVLGKVAIKREDLSQYNNKDHWFPICPVDADSEVQGKANIKISYEDVRNLKNKSSSYSSRTQLIVQIVECVELTLKNGSCDPFALVTKTVSPKFDEEFCFCNYDEREKERDTAYTVCGDCDVEISELHVSLWHDTPGMSGDVFLGEVRIPLREAQQHKPAHNNAWYFLQPRSGKNKQNTCSTPPGTRLSIDNSLGSLRLQVQYTADHVFPAHVYDPLRSLLLDSINTKPITYSSVYLLGEIVSNKSDVAQPLVRIFMHHEQIVPIIRALATAEISNLTDPTTIFRGNTLVSKMMDEAMRLIGLQYLHKTLRPTIDLVFNERKPCEIDPARVNDPNTIQSNLANLTCYVQSIFQAITQSAVECPALMCQIFHNLKECAMIYLPENKEVRYSVISGFIFLRFFAPAILGPRLFDLTTEQIDSQINRTLTLISKTIQSLGNLVSCKSPQQLCKEEYMECIYRKFCTEQHIQAVRQFLEIISANTSSQHIMSIDTPVTLKEGIMIKRAQGRKRFGRKNFKQRYFRLTTHDLSYSKSKGKEALCKIPLSNILAVERLAEHSFKMKNMFQIVQRERALYVQAANCVEEKEWVDLLTKICQTNKNRLTKYHPSAFRNGQWRCCQSPIELAPGCKEVSSIDSNNFHMTLDPERDLQRMHSLIITELNKRDLKNKNVSDPCLILNKLQEVVYQIEHKHKCYQRSIARDTKYGSK